MEPGDMAEFAVRLRRSRRNIYFQRSRKNCAKGPFLSGKFLCNGVIMNCFRIDSDRGKLLHRSSENTHSALCHRRIIKDIVVRDGKVCPSVVKVRHPSSLSAFRIEEVKLVISVQVCDIFDIIIP